MTQSTKNGASDYKWAFRVTFGLLQLLVVGMIAVFYNHTQATGHPVSETKFEAMDAKLNHLVAQVDTVERIQWLLFARLSPDEAAEMLREAEKMP